MIAATSFSASAPSAKGLASQQARAVEQYLSSGGSITDTKAILAVKRGVTTEAKGDK